MSQGAAPSASEPQSSNTSGMAAVVQGLRGDTARAQFACIFCKRRKMKCDRLLPLCSMCKKTGQECEYPLEAAKPGPKIGTTRRKRARSGSSGERASRLAAHGRPDEFEWGVSTDNVVDSAIVSNSGESMGDAEKSSNGIEPQSYPLSPATTPLDVRTLSYIMHPSHDVTEISSPGEGWSGEADLAGQAGTSFSTSIIVDRACSVLGIQPHLLPRFINLYFATMVSFSLFHRPSFQSKLRNITSETQLVALLASMFSFLARFRPDFESESFRDQQTGGDKPLWLPQPPRYYEELSEQYVDQAMKECSSEAPPLCLLQSLMLLTFQQLIKGVCGSAWRRLGVCIRVAYELNLHHVDIDNVPEEQDVTLWCEIEEQRRVWWAVWEMDVFASTIKRCPSGIDWTDNETRLPVSDEHWFNGEFHPSCFLEAKPMDRLKALQRCGNEGTKAWFIILDSYMREGHVISKFRSPRPGTGRQGSSRIMPKDTTKGTTESLGALANALRCFSMALPKHLRYRDEYLSFSSRDPSQVVIVRRQHNDKYSIHVMTQLARIMIHHQDAFRGAQQDLQLVGANNVGRHDSSVAGDSAYLCLRMGPTRKGLQQYIDAADELLHIVSQSAEEHVRYVNPFLASTIWFGAAVHRAWKVLAPPRMNHDYIASKFEVMRMNFNNFSLFWDLPRSLQENLHTMEDKLKIFILPKRRRSSFGSNGIRGGSSQAGSVRSGSRPFSSSLVPGVVTATTMATVVSGQSATMIGPSKPHRPSFTNTNREPYARPAVWSSNTQTSGEDMRCLGVSPMAGGGDSGSLMFGMPPNMGENWSGQGNAVVEYQNSLAPEESSDDLLLGADFTMDPDSLFLALSNFS